PSARQSRRDEFTNSKPMRGMAGVIRALSNGCRTYPAAPICSTSTERFVRDNLRLRMPSQHRVRLHSTREVRLEALIADGSMIRTRTDQALNAIRRLVEQ